MRFKRMASILLAVILLMPSLCNVKADNPDLGDHGDEGGGESGIKTDNRFTWNELQSGYRFTIIDKEFNVVSNSVDLLFSSPIGDFGVNDKDWYKTSRAHGFIGHTYYTIQSLMSPSNNAIDKAPPLPIDSRSGIAVGTGTEFKEWFLNGKPGFDGTFDVVNPGNQSGGSSGKGGSGGNHYETPDKPSKGDSGGKVVPDIGVVHLDEIISSVSYRGGQLNTAKQMLKQQGNERHSIVIAEAAKTIYKGLEDSISVSSKYAGINDGKGYTENEVRIRALEQTFYMIGDSVHSKAESAFVIITVIRTCIGSSWNPQLRAKPPAGYKYYSDEMSYKESDEAKIALADTNHQESLNSRGSLDRNGFIVTASEIKSSTDKVAYGGGGTGEKKGPDGSDGYAGEILNYQPNHDGNYVFQVDNREPEDYVIDTMIKNDYSVLVEPVFWFVPAAWDTATKVRQPIYSNYVYGTITNHLEFQKRQGYRYDSHGGAYSSVLSKIGWSTMYMVKNWPADDAMHISAYDDSRSGSLNQKSLAELNTMIDSGVGIGMHIYVSFPGEVNDDTEPTNDVSVGDIPHPAPDPSELVAPEGDTKHYKIVKYYEQEMSNGEIDRQKYITEECPPSIKINNEDSYKVDDWFITTDESDGEGMYSLSKELLSISREGKETKKVMLTDGENTLHLLLKKSTEEEVSGLRLEESEVTKAVSTVDSEIPNWGPREFVFTAGDMSGSSHTHSESVDTGKKDKDGNPVYETIHHDCSIVFGDSHYNYIIKNSSKIDNLVEANGAGGIFESRMINGEKPGSISINGETVTVDNAEYQTVVWRAEDIPTIASYKEKNTVPLKALLNEYGKIPIGGRAKNGLYRKTLNIQLSVDPSSDLSTATEHSYTGETYKMVTHSYNNVESHTADLSVYIYRGLNKKEVGNETEEEKIATETYFGSTVSYHSAGYMVQDTTPIKFYPYINMTYQGVGDTEKTDVGILSEYVSEVLPNDAAEVAWYNERDKNSLALGSTQWSTHVRAVNNGKSWNGVNQVLPGGAIYMLGTRDTPTKVQVITWQTIMDEPERSALAEDLPSGEYTINKATEEHNKFADQAKKILDNLHVVQYVNADCDAENAWTDNGQMLKLTGEGGQSLSPLGLPGTTSSEEKYYLKKGTDKEGADEADLDIVSEDKSKDCYFKVFADTDGNVYLAKSIGSIEPLRSMNGTNPNGATKILTKMENASIASIVLTDYEASMIEQRTKLISNFVKALERNTGNVNGERWYNEAWDGIYVMRKATVYDVGFNNPKVRTAVLDPKLCPINMGVADLFSKAYLSQFATDDKSEIAKDKKEGYIGVFKDKEIYMSDMESIYSSKKFYIPNVNVMDLD